MWLWEARYASCRASHQREAALVNGVQNRPPERACTSSRPGCLSSLLDLPIDADSPAAREPDRFSKLQIVQYL